MYLRIFIFSYLVYIIKTIVIDTENIEWERFKREHSKNYTKDNETFRRKTWRENVQKIKSMSIQSSFTMKINGKFGDLTDEEAQNLFRFNKPENVYPSTNFTFQVNKKRIVSAPSSVDWRLNGYVTPVKDQLLCSCCTVFAATASYEGAFYKKYKTLLDISEQNFLDCTKSGFFTDYNGTVEPLISGQPVKYMYSANGCAGGNSEAVFQYAFYNGFFLSSTKPYTGSVRKILINLILKILKNVNQFIRKYSYFNL